MRELRDLLSYARPYWGRLAFVAVLMLAVSVSTLAIPALLGRVAGDIVVQKSVDTTWLIGSLLAVLVVIALLNFWYTSFGGETSALLLADLRLKMYSHLQRLPIGFHESHRQGDTLALMTEEVARFSDFLTGTLVSVAPLLLTAGGSVILMFRIDPTLGLIVPILGPALFLIVKIVGRRLQGLARSLQQARADLVQISLESLEMLPAIKMFATEDYEISRYKAKSDQTTRLFFQENRIYAVMDPLIGLVAASVAVLLVVFAGRNVHSGSMSPTQLFSFLFYAALLTRPLASLSHVYGEIRTARGTLARMQAVLSLPPEPGLNAPLNMAVPHGEIEFAGVAFAFPGRERIFSDLNLTIRAGETVALTGTNGVGKSTIVALLLRMYELEAGSITIDGRDIADIDVRDLRKHIGVVSQRVFLFGGTIGENIAYGLEGASFAQIEDAARLAHAYQFISALPDGFDTKIGDHGVLLSGGQRQRIALARAFLKNPPILVLDEANAMFDLEGELAFVEHCADALEDRTVILISHRPASLALADRIFCLEAGRAHEEDADSLPTSG